MASASVMNEGFRMVTLYTPTLPSLSFPGAWNPPSAPNMSVVVATRWSHREFMFGKS